MADNMARMEAQIRALEARRAKGESVPELDILYAQMDKANRAGAEATSKYPSGEMPASAAPKRMPPPMPPAPMIRRAKGGSIKSASKRGDGCAQRGKTKGRMV